MKVKDLLLTYDDRLFETVPIEFRQNNFFVQVITSKSYDDFMRYSKFKDMEINRWFVMIEDRRERLVIDIKGDEKK